MRAAADLEDRNEKHIVTPGRIVPARELLGDMLLELKQPGAGAEGIRGVAGARAQPLPQLRRRGARGGEAGDRDEGRRATTQKLVELAKKADTSRPELVEREGIRRAAMRRRVRSSLAHPAGAGAGGARRRSPPPTRTKTDPDLAARDADYAAGKQAVEKKNWAEAVRAFKRAEVRHPDHADLQNYLGFSYRNLKQFDARVQALQARDRARPAPPRRARYIGEAYLMWATSRARRSTSGAQGDLPAHLRALLATGGRGRSIRADHDRAASVDIPVEQLV